MRKILLTHKIGWPEMDTLTPAQYRINQLIGKLDDVCVDVEKRWGVDVLPALVNKELYDKWKIQGEKLNAAIVANDLQLVEELVEGCIRGYGVLEAKAKELGHKPHDAPVAWTCAMPSGTTLAILGTSAEAAIWQANAKPDDKMVIWTIQEIANVIDSDHTLINVLLRKSQEPKASDCNPVPFDFDKGDEIPEF